MAAAEEEEQQQEEEDNGRGKAAECEMSGVTTTMTMMNIENGLSMEIQRRYAFLLAESCQD